MKIAIIGHGVVGGGVHDLLKDGQLDIHVKRVMDRQPMKGMEHLYTDNIAEIIGDQEIDCVVEATVGVHPALSYVTAALNAGKHVVTSNKELLSLGFTQLRERAITGGVQLFYSATVGGGVPWLHNLHRVKRGDTVVSVSGIANGTTNFILDSMTRGDGFNEALTRAQRLGYAESNPTSDLMGLDTQRKCAITASIAFDTWINPEDIPTLGVGQVTAEDIAEFSARGYTCKLLMFAERAADGVAAYVEPTLLPKDSMMSHTDTNHNFIALCAEHAGRLAFYGQGAGRYPTAHAIVQDLLDIQTKNFRKLRPIVPMSVVNNLEKHPYYVRTGHLSKLPASLRAETLRDDAMITVPMTVEAAHALALKAQKKDPGAFFAGIADRAW
ncbi:MAG: homoserine dehydrogenase [Clostridia bacterium]|nr:homoserine dehydrogenase [Clostridia bacterium]